MILWESRHDGLHLYSDGKPVGVVPYDMLPALMLAIAQALKHRPES